jgi:hypothetical protein
MIFLSILIISALFISTIAAWFSIAGLVSIFPGAKLAIILMGSSLELGKLVTASWLYRFWDKANFAIRAYFTVAVLVLSVITSVGIFGYLTKSHIEGGVEIGVNSEQLSLVDEQITLERDNIAQQRVFQQQLDAAVNNLVQNENTTERAITIRNSQRRDRVAIASSISESNQKIQQLQSQRLEFTAAQRELETEIGPIKYVAQMIYGDDDVETIEKSVRWLTILLIIVFDPLAILLVVAANMQFRELKNKKHQQNIKESDNVTEITNDWDVNNWFKIVNSKNTDG